jgi:hypothetical protein
MYVHWIDWQCSSNSQLELLWCMLPEAPEAALCVRFRPQYS